MQGWTFFGTSRLTRLPLFQNNVHTVIATPHIAGVTDLSYNDIARGLAANVNRLRAGEPPINCVNLAATDPLFQNNVHTVIATPHIAGVTDWKNRRIARAARVSPA